MVFCLADLFMRRCERNTNGSLCAIHPIDSASFLICLTEGPKGDDALQLTFIMEGRCTFVQAPTAQAKRWRRSFRRASLRSGARKKFFY
jgi:hypothetical protein